MEKKKLFTTKNIALTGILLAVEIVLQLLSYIIPTPININLSLIPITIGAILGGPIVGCFLGFMSGVIVILSPNTVNMFMAISPIGTILTCLIKTSIAGLLAGLIVKAFKEKHDVLSSILASLVVPIINTGLFVIFAYFFFKEGLGFDSFANLFAAFIGVNFLFEIVSTVLIAPSLIKIVIAKKNIVSRCWLIKYNELNIIEGEHNYGRFFRSRLH